MRRSQEPGKSTPPHPPHRAHPSPLTWGLPRRPITVIKNAGPKKIFHGFRHMTVILAKQCTIGAAIRCETDVLEPDPTVCWIPESIMTSALTRRSGEGLRASLTFCLSDCARLARSKINVTRDQLSLPHLQWFKRHFGNKTVRAQLSTMNNSQTFQHGEVMKMSYLNVVLTLSCLLGWGGSALARVCELTC